MKKFEIKELPGENWIVSHNECPKFTCQFQDKKFNDTRIINGLENPMGDPREVKLLRHMELWLTLYHNEKIT